MGLNFTYQTNSGKIEIRTDEREDFGEISEEIRQLSKVIKEEFGNMDNSAVRQEDKTEIDGELDKNNRSLLDRVKNPDDDILRIIEIEEEMPPRILESDKLEASSKTEKMRKGALILLTIWEEHYGEEWIKSSRLKDALRDSNLPYERLDYLYNGENFNKFFRRRGKGKGSELSVTRPGKDKGKEILQELIEGTI